MKRDLNLIRQLCFAIEDVDDQIPSTSLKLEGYTDHQVGYHCELMHEAGLLQAESITCLSSQYPELMIYRLTWSGHDFADASRDDTIWARAISVVSGVKSVAFDVFRAKLSELATDAIGPVATWVRDSAGNGG